MAVIETRFRVTADKVRGSAALEGILEALSQVLPFARMTHVTLDHRTFQIATERFPDTIWHRLLENRAWHPKLVSHLIESLAEASPSARQKQQQKFYRLLQKTDARVGIAGALMYDEESTPGLLMSVIFPKMRELDCRLKVDAYGEMMKTRHEGPNPHLYVMMLQRQFYRDHEALSSH